jgi:hypothetical protein
MGTSNSSRSVSVPQPEHFGMQASILHGSASTWKMRIDLAAFQIGGKSNEFSGSMALKELDCSFMPLGCFPRGECPQVAPLAVFRIFLAGIQAIFS